MRVSQANIQHSLEMVLGELENHHDWAAKVGLLTILVLLLWKAFVPARLKLVPHPLVAVVIATIVTAILKLPVLYVEVPDNLWNEIHFPSLAAVNRFLSASFSRRVLCWRWWPVPKHYSVPRRSTRCNPDTRTQYDRELAAQGIGNMVCGLLGHCR